MRSALLFLLIASSLARYEITGKFQVIECSCNQKDPEQVTDFYKGRVVVFKAEKDVSKWPYNDPDQLVDVAATTQLDMDRVYVLKKYKQIDDDEPGTFLYLNVPDCSEMTKADCPTDLCKPTEDGCTTNAPCIGIEETKCEENDKCEWREENIYDLPPGCYLKPPPCTDYKDNFTCVKSDCTWVGKKCVESTNARSNVSARVAVDSEDYSCAWSNEDAILKCKRMYNNIGSFTLQRLDGAGKVLATLAVVVFAVIAVLF